MNQLLREWVFLEVFRKESCSYGAVNLYYTFQKLWMNNRQKWAVVGFQFFAEEDQNNV